METAEARVKRLKMRSMRRGIREMDLILSDFAERELDGMAEAGLALYDALLSENDHDLYGWITGQAEPPRQFADLVARLRHGAAGVVRSR
jgi:antitoxin CptB